MRLKIFPSIVPVFALLGLLTILSGCQRQTDGQAGAEQSSSEDTADAGNKGEKRESPDSVGFEKSALTGMGQSIESGDWGNIHAVLIQHEKGLVYEAYFPGEDERMGKPLGRIEFSASTKHDVRSVTKSIISILIGIALDQKLIASIDTPVRELLPDYANYLEGKKASINLKHVLTMSSGLRWDETSLPYSDARNDERRMHASKDPVAFYLGKELVNEPGTHWNYSGGSAQLLAAILETSTGMELEKYANEVLFEPLGIEDAEWMGDLNGTPLGASGLRMRGRDLIKLGSLLAKQGHWNGKPIVSESWIILSTQSHIGLGESGDPAFVLESGYGFQWWYSEFATSGEPLKVWAAVGNGGQRIFVLPEFQIVVAVLAGDYNDARHFWTPEKLLIEHIVPVIVNLRQRDH